jgi:hypothetical protein
MILDLLADHYIGIKQDKLDDLLTRLDPRDAEIIKQKCNVALEIKDAPVKIYRRGNEVFALHDNGQVVAYGRWESDGGKATNILVQGGYEYGCKLVPKQIFYDLILRENDEAESSLSDTPRMIDFWFRMSMYARENGCSVHFIEGDKILPFDSWRKPKGTIRYTRR